MNIKDAVMDIMDGFVGFDSLDYDEMQKEGERISKIIQSAIRTEIERIWNQIDDTWPCTCSQKHDYECATCELLKDEKVWE